jgi:hypothetical protein
VLGDTCSLKLDMIIWKLFSLTEYVRNLHEQFFDCNFHIQKEIGRGQSYQNQLTTPHTPVAKEINYFFFLAKNFKGNTGSKTPLHA